MLGEEITPIYSDNTDDLYYLDFKQDEITITQEELLQVELDVRRVKKLIKSSTLIADLITPGTICSYQHPQRTRMEVEGGYRIAVNKGARLSEIKIFNLIMRFKNDVYDTSDALAFTHRPKRNNEEWIILQPDDTLATIQTEKSIHLQFAREYELAGKISKINIMNLEHNLDQLNIPERCAQTLMHEYGHILHWRMFDNQLNSTDNQDIYNWFYHSGYASLLDRRTPLFYTASFSDKLYLLKESLVEDYRIYLNRSVHSGMFILPNKYTYAADLSKPDLLMEGVNIMKEMLKPAIENTNMRRKTGTIFKEQADYAIMHDIRIQALKGDWTPGMQRMSNSDHEKIISKLQDKNIQKKELKINL